VGDVVLSMISLMKIGLIANGLLGIILGLLVAVSIIIELMQ